MKPQKLIRLTNEMLDESKTFRGGWTREQLRLYRVPWPPTKGWKRGLVGTLILSDTYEQILELRSTRKKRTQPDYDSVGFLFVELDPQHEFNDYHGPRAERMREPKK